MLLALLWPILGLFFLRLRIAPFPAAVLAMLVFPLIALPLVSLGGMAFGVIGGSALVLAVISRLPLRLERLRSQRAGSGFGELMLVPILYLPLRLLVSRWPEFYNLGEHIRDFAVLSAVIRDPLHPADPWCDSLVLNYYVYWYRFAAIVGRIVPLSTASTYHLFIALTPAVLFALLTRLGRIAGGWSWLVSLSAAAIITFGSNVAGLIAVGQHTFWWGPSRAIPVGITEFPAWSFLLGDLHPHFLSLVLPPGFLLIALESGQSGLPGVRRTGLTLLYVVSCAALTASANTWDLFGLALAALPLIAALHFAPVSESHWTKREVLISSAFMLAAVLLAVISNAHMQRAPIELKVVGSGIARATLAQYLSHWGFPLILIAASALVLRRDLFRMRLGTLLTAGALLILAFAELFYFDDPYTGDAERLNTIFKLFVFAWVPLHFGAFLLFSDALSKLPPNLRAPSIRYPVLLTGITLSTAFFFYAALSPNGRTVKLARYIEPRDEGLSKLENDTPGAAQAIRVLRGIDAGERVLEWNEPGYSAAANFCSLSEHSCYAGWRNHLSIQYRTGLEELSRRERIIRQLYTEGGCEAKRSLALSERIGAVVLGPRERGAFPELNAESFGCFEPLFHEGSLSVVRP